MLSGALLNNLNEKTKIKTERIKRKENEMSMLENTNNSFRYINFLILVDQACQEFDYPTLDVHEMKLFETLVILMQKTKACTVSYVVSAVEYASFSATYRRLKKLKHVGYVHLITDELDNRVKYVALTPMAMAYLDLMGQLMNKAGGVVSAY